jgi:peptide methionine sulfoxide reductase MsrB
MSNLLAADRTDKIVKSDAAWRAPLTSDATFESGTGWPSFGQPASNGAALAFKPGDP